MKQEGIILSYLAVERGCSLLVGKVLVLLPKESPFQPLPVSSPLWAVLTWTCSRMRDHDLSGPADVTATQVLWRTNQFWSQIRNVYNWRESLGTLGYLRDNLDFLVSHPLPRTGFSFLPGKPLLWDHCLPISEKSMQTYTHIYTSFRVRICF